jgi:hypothetical protein
VNGYALNAHSVEDCLGVARRVGHSSARHPIRTTAAGPVVGDEPDAEIGDDTDRA